MAIVESLFLFLCNTFVNALQPETNSNKPVVEQVLLIAHYNKEHITLQVRERCLSKTVLETT